MANLKSAGNIKPEVIYATSLRVGFLWIVLRDFAITFLAGLLMKETGILPVNIIYIVGFALLVSILDGLSRYYFTKSVGGKIMAEGDQKGLRQVLYISVIIMIVSIIWAIVSPAMLSRVIGLIGVLIIVFGLFYWRLKNVQKERGVDNTPVLNISEKWWIGIGIVFILGVIMAAYLLNKYYW